VTDPIEISDVPAGAAFDAWRIPVLSHAEFDALSSGALVGAQQLEYLAQLALLAPTTHNTVPQRFRCGSSNGAALIEFALDRRAILPHSDPSGRQATISLGASIANAWIAARVYGLAVTMTLATDAEPRIRPASPDATVADSIVPVATLRLERAASPSSNREPDWVHAMLARKMVRAEFDERVKLDQTLAAELVAIVRQTHPGLTLHLLTDSPTLLALGKFQELADSTVINRVAFARELSDWLLDNDSDGAVGMRGREFGLANDAARRFREGLAGRGPLLPDETVAFAKSGNLGMRSASAVGVITAQRDDVEHRLAAGRAFEELALRLTLAGMSVAMHAGITEVEAPNRALGGRLRTFHRPTVVFRLGRPLRAVDALRPHSSRPRLSDVTY
jgi:hypothetical protein